MTTDQPSGPSGSHNTHARFSPSGAHQWGHCLGSIAFIEANAHRIPKDNSTVYSKEGTDCHDWATKVFNKEITIDKVPENFRQYVADYVDHCMALVPSGSSPMVEVQVPLYYQPTKTGTADFAVVTDSRVVIRDLKFGAGVLVLADSNEQLAIYAMSLIKMFEDIYDFSPDTVVDIGIFQPRHREAQNSQPWIISLKDLETFCEAIEYAFIQASTGLARVQEKILKDKAPKRDVSCAEILEAAPGLKFCPRDGDNGCCRFCKAKGCCDARLAAAVEGMNLPDTSGEDLLALLPDLDKKEAKETPETRIQIRAKAAGIPREALTDEYLVKLLECKPAIIKFLSDVEETLEARVMAGEQVPGIKIVLGRAGNRAWVNEEAADTFLKGQGLKQEDRYKFTLKSPTQMEEALKEKLTKSKRTANRFAELVSRSDPQRTIALASDKREAISAVIDALPDMAEIDDFEV